MLVIKNVVMNVANVKKPNVVIVIVRHMDHLYLALMELIKIIDLAVLLKGSVVIVVVVLI